MRHAVHHLNNVSVCQMSDKNVIFNVWNIPNLSIEKYFFVSLVFHFGQLIKSDRFCQYDYGKGQNLEVYGQETPPDYDLKKISARIAIIYSEADVVVPAEDVLRLSKLLPNLVAIHRVTDNTYAHMDFMWAEDAKKLVYDHIFDWLKTEEER